jgi:hypothetical protein
MYSELTNLLPTDRRRAMRREYFVHLATVGVWLLVILVIVQGVLLLPSYLYESETAATRTAQLKDLSAHLATSQQQQVQSSLTALKTESTSLLTLNTIPTASTALRAVLAVPRPGISLTGFTFTPSGTGTTGTARAMQLTGTAATRENLSSYDNALAALPFVTNANLPISDYAMDNNIPFQITLTGSLMPAATP